MKKWMRRIGFMALCLGAFTLSSGVFAARPAVPPGQVDNCRTLVGQVATVCNVIIHGRPGTPRHITACEELPELVVQVHDSGCKLERVCKYTQWCASTP